MGGGTGEKDGLRAEFLQEQDFILTLGMPGDTLATTYPFTLTLNLNIESYPADNTYNGQVLTVMIVSLSLIQILHKIMKLNRAALTPK